jgi:hypothetical protein
MATYRATQWMELFGNIERFDRITKTMPAGLVKDSFTNAINMLYARLYQHNKDENIPKTCTVAQYKSRAKGCDSVGFFQAYYTMKSYDIWTEMWDSFYAQMKNTIRDMEQQVATNTAVPTIIAPPAPQPTVVTPMTPDGGGGTVYTKPKPSVVTPWIDAQFVDGNTSVDTMKVVAIIGLVGVVAYMLLRKRK